LDLGDRVGFELGDELLGDSELVGVRAGVQHAPWVEADRGGACCQPHGRRV
jgi:hypothetical protein